MGGERGSMGKLVRSVVAGVLRSEDDRFVCGELEASESVRRELVFGMYEEAEQELDELDLVLLSMFSRLQFGLVPLRRVSDC